MTLKGTTAEHPVCDNAKHPKDQQPKMQRLYKRINRAFKPCGWVCPECNLVKVDMIDV